MLPACDCMPSFPRPPCQLGELSPQFNETAVGRATLWTPGCCQSLPHHCGWSSPPKGLAVQATESTFSRAGACERTKLRQGFARGLRPPGDDPPLTRRAAQTVRIDASDLRCAMNSLRKSLRQASGVRRRCVQSTFKFMASAAQSGLGFRPRPQSLWATRAARELALPS